MKNFFLKKNIIITGATSGVGKSLSLMLGKYDSNLLLISKSEEKLLKLKNDIGNKLAKIEILGVDLSKNESPQKIYNFSSSHFKNIDIIINNAGIGYSSFVTEIDKDIAQEVWKQISICMFLVGIEISMCHRLKDTTKYWALISRKSKLKDKDFCMEQV